MHCSIVVSEWMFELASQLDATNCGELLVAAVNYLSFDALRMAVCSIE